MKKLLFLFAFFILTCVAIAQPVSIAVQIDTFIHGADTLALQARRTNIVNDLSGGSYTLKLDAPGAGYAGFEVTIVQLNASGGAQLTLNTLADGGENEFQASNSATSSVVFTADAYQVLSFTCLEVATGTFRWVLTNP